MAETLSPRFGLIIWGASSDGPSRLEFNNAFAAIEANGAISSGGAIGSRPAAGVRDRYYWDTTNKYLWRDSGTGWDLTSQNSQDTLFRSSAVSAVPLTINAIASQTASLVDAQVNGSSKFLVSAAGSVTANIFTGKSVSVTNDTLGNPVIFGKGAASQSANLLTLQDNSAANMFSVSAAGLITSPSFATVGSGASTGAVVNAATPTSVAGSSRWSGAPSFEVRANRTGAFKDFILMKHADADASAAERNLGILFRVGTAEDSGTSVRSAAVYLRSEFASFGSPSLAIDVSDIRLWDMAADPLYGSNTFYPIQVQGAYVQANPSSTGAFRANNTWIGTQNGGQSMYFRSFSENDQFSWYGGGTHSSTLNDTGGGLEMAKLFNVNGHGWFEVGKIHLNAISDADASQTIPTFSIGNLTGQHLQFDDNEILGVNNLSLDNAFLTLQAGGGALNLGSASTHVEINAVGFNISTNGSAPAGTHATGDVWLDSRSGQGLKRYNGSTWVAF